MNLDPSRLLNLLISIPIFVAALTVHEFAHAWMGNRLGDDTARRLGRLTLDPMKHLDPLGSLVFLLGALSGFFFGWAKPVPFNPRNLEHPRRDAMLIALAGPVSNILQVPFWLLALWLGAKIVAQVTGHIPVEVLVAVVLGGDGPLDPSLILLRMCALGIIINLTLAAFNMIPLPPLDGHYVLEFFGPPFITDLYNAIRPYSFIILLVLINLPNNPITAVLMPIRQFAVSLIVWALGLGWMPF